MRYRDGELPAAHAADVKNHLYSCDRCRTELELSQRMLLKIRRDVGRPDDATVWSGVVSKIRDWEVAQREPEMSAKAIRGRVADHIGCFLGIRAAHRVLDPVSPNNQDLLSILEPVLGEFLGPGAAAALIDHVVDTAILRV